MQRCYTYVIIIIIYMFWSVAEASPFRYRLVHCGMAWIPQRTRTVTYTFVSDHYSRALPLRLVVFWMGQYIKYLVGDRKTEGCFQFLII